MLEALLPTTALAALAIAAPAQAAPVTTTYTTAGESVFVVPPGVHHVDVALTGARGGSQSPVVPGGRGATVDGRLDVTPGQWLYAEVGGAGTDFGSGLAGQSNPGGANGGGAGSAGGGASDIRTMPAYATGSLETRLAVAGGGGGAQRARR